MKKLKIIIIILITTHLAVGQKFSFQMYFEDAIGNKDTLTIGFDINGTDTIDTEFGEVNIISIPIDTALDVRISNEWQNRLYQNIPGTFHTKKQIIKKKECGIWYSLNSIDIITNNWPVYVRWDSTLFSDTCLNGSLFTSVMPGGWWDTGGFREVLIGSNSLSFEPNYPYYDDYYGYINDNNDTIDVFWQTFGDSTLITTAINETIDREKIKIFPNPTSKNITIENISQTLRIDEIKIVDINSKKQPISMTGKNIDLTGLPAGVYFIQLLMSNGHTLTKKIIKNNER
ncbi:MAG: T9SS type A sorting domain-containing protein [Bacteroidota bacterium]